MGAPENEKDILSTSTFAQLPAPGSDKDTLSSHNPHITEEEQKILDRQLNSGIPRSSYFMLYRYASRTDLAIIAVSALCSITAGAAFPLLTVSISPPLISTNQTEF